MFKTPLKPKKALLGQKLLRIEWEQNSRVAMEFDVEYRVRGAAQWQHWHGPQNRQGVRNVTTIMGLLPSTEYEFRVRGKKWIFKTKYSHLLHASTLRNEPLFGSYSPMS